MAYTIAFSGKGGTGKTTLACLSICYFLDKKLTPILAVDADPNSNFNVGLGMEFSQTLADIREEVLDKKVPQGVAKSDFIQRRIDEILVEGEDIDLLVMGRPEGPGCYCAINHLLRDYLDRLSKHYKAIVMDTEAGLEHLSRRTTNELDVLFLVSDLSPVALRAASGSQEIARKLKLNIKKIYLILNRINSQVPAGIKEEILKKNNLELIGMVAEDEEINSFWQQAKPIINLSPSSNAKKAIAETLSRILCKNIR